MDVTDPYQPIVGYTDYANYTGFVHFNSETANFVEKVGEREFMQIPTSPLIGSSIPTVVSPLMARKIGSLVTIEFPAISALGANTLPSISFLTAGGTPQPIPTNFLPNLLPYSTPFVTNGGAGAALAKEVGILTINADGTITISRPSGTNFNGAGAGYPSQHISYYAVL
jgi:hypothetical protein